MTTLNISLPESMKDFVESQIREGGYSTASEYVRELIREAKKRSARDKLEQLVLEGVNSGPPIRVDDEYFNRKKAAFKSRHRASKRRK
ncbi:MAG: type II toxin-antitoxin system ParD family antitoxin [Planctomycetia bacterium]|nr:type II toxin-antitoxin system ParD family antitoxin [Planctomycetia bacterium]